MKKNIWVEKLGIPDLLALCAESAISGASIRYDENKASYGATLLVDVLQRWGLCRNVHKAGLSLDKRDEDGYAINYEMENDTDICRTRFCDKYTGSDSPRFNNAVRLHITAYLTYRVTFITMVRHERDFKDTDSVNVIYLERHPMNAVIMPYYREKGYLLIESIIPLEHIRQYMKPFHRLWSIIVYRLLAGKVDTNIAEPKPSVWVEYAQNCAEDHMFWRGHLDEKMFDIVCYLDRNDNIPLERQIRDIEGDGLKWIDLHFRQLVKLSRIGIRELTDMIGAFFSSPANAPLWFRLFKFEYRMWYLLYRPVFSRFKVKVLMQHQITQWTQAPQLEALEDAGGIAIGFHRSNSVYYMITPVAHFQHVYFVWGRMNYEWIKKRGDTCRYVLPSGLCVVRHKEGSAIAGLKEGLKFIIAVFDSSAAYNIYQDEHSLAEFYIRIFTLMEKNAEWGGIVKSKSRTMADIERLPRGEEILKKMKSLIVQKRLVYMDASNSPLTASSAVDLSICYSINTAGIWAGIYGQRAVHWDSAGFLHYPCYRDREQKFIFRDMGELEQAIVKASQGDTTIGDLSAWRRILNHFDDDKAVGRIGQFIQDFMREESVSGDADASLERVVKKYRADNRIDEDFYTPHGLWEMENTNVMREAL
ncbi:MAG: hypothetical protein JXB40_00035 [Candidatus Omnitrophica bacterium]|nr:hypothetical protein [Candidatus Omnitrophota bacterium]